MDLFDKTPFVLYVFETGTMVPERGLRVLVAPLHGLPAIQRMNITTLPSMRPIGGTGNLLLITQYVIS